jgi:hypothetical protein
MRREYNNFFGLNGYLTAKVGFWVTIWSSSTRPTGYNIFEAIKYN